ncbi:MAG: DNA topoisomerase IV subunit B, partial [Spirochaetes bacterium]|nr:DNA topoisomerase IV subunit B [Spirochaetota bacterium]
MSDDKRLNSQYSGSDIQILEGLEAVRTRPGMYIGSTSDTGLHHLVREIVDNSIDEALAGYCDHIEVEIQPNGSISVTDNGRGIPVDIHPKTGESALEAVFTVLHAGGKFGGKSYKVSGGLHGVGASVVNALSEWLKVTVFKDGYVYEQEYGRGKKLYNVRRIGITDKTGTVVLFKPDSTIFKEGTEFDYETLASHLQQSAFLNKGLKLTLIDLRNPYRVRTNTYQYDNGIIEYVKYLNQSKTPIHNEIIYLSGKVNNVEVDIAMQYTDDETCRIHSYANNINTPDGGTHEEGFKTRLT